MSSKAQNASPVEANHAVRPWTKTGWRPKRALRLGGSISAIDHRGLSRSRSCHQSLVRALLSKFEQGGNGFAGLLKCGSEYSLIESLRARADKE